MVRYKVEDRSSGSRIGIFTSFKSDLWPCFQCLLEILLIRAPVLEYSSDIS